MDALSNSLAAADIAHVVHPVTNLRAHEANGPLVMARGEGIRVYDERGKEYIEGLAGLWSVGVGFSEKRLAEAAYRQMLKLPYYHTFTSKSNEPSIRLAETLAEMTPEPLTRAFFTSSGSEANDTIVKMVWYRNNALGKPEKKTFLARTKAYHGITIASGSLTGLPTNHRDFDLPAIPVRHLTCPHFYRFGQEGESEAEFTARLLRELEGVIGERDLMGNAARLEQPFQAGLQSFAGHPLVGEVRGAGLIGALELVADKATRRPFEKAGRAGQIAAAIGHEEGLIFRAIGDQLALCPPMIVTQEDVGEIMTRLGRTLEHLTGAVAAEGLV